MNPRPDARFSLRIATAPPVDLDAFDAVLFDLDGVLTSTAQLHAATWKQAFDEFLTGRVVAPGPGTRPFTIDVDYPQWVDGKPREDGVRDFLRSRGIDVPDAEVAAIAARKQELVDARLRTEGVDAFPGSVAWLETLRAAGTPTAVVTSSRNATAVLAAAGLAGRFDTQVDGTTIETLGLPGKPAPDAFLEAARRLGVAASRAVVVEDALAGVRAARAGGFGLVIGVDRVGQADALRAAGAHVVVEDLAELLPHEPDDGEPPVDPYRIVEHHFDPERVPQYESIFALSNGYLGLRGTHEEGTPAYAPAALLNGFHETWPIRYPEGAFGLATTGQTIAGVPDGSIVRLYLDDERFDLTRVDILDYERVLDMAAGTLERHVTWRAADGCRFSLRTRRLVSFEHKHLASLEYEVTSLDRPARFTIASDLALHRDDVDTDDDPRRAPELGTDAFVPAGDHLHGDRAVVAMRTRSSNLVMACGMDHEVTSGGPIEPDPTLLDAYSARVVYRAHVEPGCPVRLVKHLTYHYTADAPHARDLFFRVGETLDRARADGFERIARTQRKHLDRCWAVSDVVVEGAPKLQQAVRFNIFQLLQASARVEGHGIPAKGLTGRGYEGQYFWDTEIYVQPFLICTAPHIARSLLRHRYGMLDAARRRAQTLGHRGALFPWRTINGEEASAQYAAGTAQYHINADIAYSLLRYVRATGDDDVLTRFGGELLVETARLWVDLGFFSERKGGRFVINGVTGPDEYSTVVDNNTYTNLMARENLRRAAEVVDWMRAEDPSSFAELVANTGLTADEPARWRHAAEQMYVPYDEQAGVHLQDDGFLDRQPWDFEATPPEHYPLLLHYHPLVIYRHQVIKQADVVLATFLLGSSFTKDEKRRIFEYYDPITTGDSSLSESIQSVMAAEVGDLRAAEDYLVHAATIDLCDTAGNVRDGVHVASAGGTWIALVCGFGGLRHRGHEPSFAPQLPGRVTRLCFSLLTLGSRLRVDIRAAGVAYTVTEGPGLTIRHYDEHLELTPGVPVVRPLAPSAPTPDVAPLEAVA
jgi:alpha,alpha-trehalose phosphorylase